jgi:adenosine deaminase
MSESRAFFASMPKAEVHLHLEGTISPETLWAMAERNHVALPVSSLEELKALYCFESFEKFIELWLAMCACLRKPQDYEQTVDGFLAECARQNIRYAELHFTPFNHERFGLGGRRALDIVTQRLQSAESVGGPVTRLIVDIPSESVPESGLWTAESSRRRRIRSWSRSGSVDQRTVSPDHSSRPISSAPELPATLQSHTRAKPRARTTSDRRCSS